jgi:hypothetical protein
MSSRNVASEPITGRFRSRRSKPQCSYLRDFLVGIGARSANAVCFSHHDEHRALFKGKVLRWIREESRTLIFHCQQQDVVFLLKLQLVNLLPDPRGSRDPDFFNAERVGVFFQHQIEKAHRIGSQNFTRQSQTANSVG